MLFLNHLVIKKNVKIKMDLVYVKRETIIRLSLVDINIENHKYNYNNIIKSLKIL